MDWTRLKDQYHVVYTSIVPDARADVIRHKYQSDHDQRRQGAIYYVNVYPMASLGELAGELYKCEENKAIEAFKAQLPKAKGNSCNCVDCVDVVYYTVTVYIVHCERFCYDIWPFVELCLLCTVCSTSAVLC